MLSSSAKPYIQASVPVLRAHGLAITTAFYKNMFAEHPELKNLFNQGNQANGSQQQSLASAVFAYAANIENAAALQPVIERIVHKHVSVGILSSHYPIVGKHLLGAISEVLGAAATPALLAAWGEAYWSLANALIAAEARLYEANGNQEKQWLKMRVLSKRELTDDITELTLGAVSEENIPPFKAGQYISIAAFLDTVGLRQIRQYSLSNAEGEACYRIAVKRARGDDMKPEGMFSKWIHEHVQEGQVLEVSHPYGTFVPELDSAKPITLISAGVGITPMVSILNSLAKRQTQRKVTFIHAARSEDHLVHYEELKRAEKHLKSLRTFVYLKQTSHPAFMRGKIEWSDIAVGEWQDGRFYICGPTPFMDDQYRALVQRGVPPQNIEREVFGPESLSHLI